REEKYNRVVKEVLENSKTIAGGLSIRDELKADFALEGTSAETAGRIATILEETRKAARSTLDANEFFKRNLLNRPAVLWLKLLASSNIDRKGTTIRISSKVTPEMLRVVPLARKSPAPAR